MRRIRKTEKNKRGCDYCADVIPPNPFGNHPTRRCPHDKCPYHELDGYKSYSEYLKNVCDLSVGELLIAIKRSERA